MLSKQHDSGWRWWRKSKHPSQICSLHRFLDTHLFATKDGGYGLCFQVTGIDDEALTRQRLNELTERVNGALQNLPGEITTYHWWVRKKGFHPPRRAEYPSEVTRRTEDARLQFLEENATFGTVELVIGLHISSTSLFRKRKPEDAALHNLRRIRTLRNAAVILKTQLRADAPLQPMNEAAVKSHFGYLMTGEQYLTGNYPTARTKVDQQLARVSIEWLDDHLRIGKRYAKLFNLIRRPIGTRPALFAELLTLDCDVVVCMEWHKQSSALTHKAVSGQEMAVGVSSERLATRMIHKKGQTPKTAQSVASSKSVDKLGAIVNDLDNRGKRFGKFSMSCMIHSRSLEHLEQIAPEVHRIFLDPAQAVTLEETAGAMAAYYSLFPGNQKWNVRRKWLKDAHYANLSFPYQPFSGVPWSPDLDAEYLAICETRDRTPFYFSPYIGGLRGLLIIGAPRRGKSVYGNFFVNHEQKFNGFTTIYDIGFSYANTVLAHGGTVVAVGLYGPRMNPFAGELSDVRVHAVINLIRLFFMRGATLTPQEEQMLHTKIRLMWEYPPELRRLKNLILPVNLQPYLRKWTEGGVYGNVFDNVEDELVQSRLQAFDFQDVDERHADLMAPALYWISFLKESLRHDPKYWGLPKHDVFEELHKHLENDQMWEFILSDMKTGGKHLGGVTLLTHHIDDLGANASLIKNACPMTLFLGGDLDRRRYRELFRLTEHELDLIESLHITEAYLKTPQYGKVILLNLDTPSLAMFTTKPKERLARMNLIQQHGQEKGMELFTRELTA